MLGSAGQLGLIVYYEIMNAVLQTPRQKLRCKCQLTTVNVKEIGTGLDEHIEQLQRSTILELGLFVHTRLLFLCWHLAKNKSVENKRQ